MNTMKLDAGFPISITREYSGKFAYVDIETTGFMSDNNYIYLIGAALPADGQPVYRYWFANDTCEEKKILTEFINYIQEFDLLIHFNGTTFDIPFIEKRCNIHGIECSLKSMEQLDLYKMIHSKRKHLKLSGFKQKEIEEALGFYREDKYSGRELIRIYHAYQSMLKLDTKGAKEETQKLFEILFLHNFEDIKYMVLISHLLDCKLFFSEMHVKDLIWEDKNITAKCTLQEDKFDLKTYNYSLLQKYLDLHELTPFGLSSYTYDKEGTISLIINLYRGELKYYFEDYKNYYYLPCEDTAMHKSVAKYVDAEHRINATKDNCYIRKKGAFISFPARNSGKSNEIIDYLNNENLKYFSVNRDDNIKYINLEEVKDKVTNCAYNSLNIYMKILLNYIL